MKSLKRFAGTGLITILAATVAFAGTIPGSRNGTIVGSRNGTIVGSRNGTIVGSRNGTIVGSRNGTIVGSSNGTIVGSRNGIIPTATDQGFRSNIQDELLSSLLLYLSIVW